MTTHATPLFVFHCEMDLACTYAMVNRDLASDCAARALFAALRAERPDLAYRANALLGAL